MKTVIGVAALLVCLCVGSYAQADVQLSDQADVTDVGVTGGELLAQASSSVVYIADVSVKNDAPAPDAEPVPSIVDMLIEKVKQLKEALDDYKDKGDGKSNTRDLLAFLLAILGVVTAGILVVLRWMDRRTDE